MTDAPPSPGWYDDPDGRRRWWSGTHWGAYAPWGESSGADAPPSVPERPKLDRSLTFDPTAAGRIARAQPSAPAEPSAPLRSSAFLPAGAGAHGGLRAHGDVGAQGPAAKRTKRLAIAYALAIVLGLLGGHRFYLGRVLSATLQMMLSFAAAAAGVVLHGAGDAPAWLLAAPIAAIGWWLADLLRLPGMVQARDPR